MFNRFYLKFAMTVAGALALTTFAIAARADTVASLVTTGAPVTVVTAQPWVDFVSSIVNPAIGAIASAILFFLFREIKAITGRTLATDLQAQIIAWATKEAQVLAAKVEGNLGSKSFTIGSSEVAAIVNAAPVDILRILTTLGWTTDDLANWVVAAIGKLQQSAPVVVATPVIVAPKP